MIRRLGARYELQEPIGGGGMAVVYRAVDTLLDRTVAVKMLRPQYAGDDEFVSRFRQEAQSAARLSHPNIVNLYDIGVSNNEYYLVMEYVDGPTLKDVIRKSAPLEIEDVIDISVQICDALEHAHQRHIIHRDVKPHNILLTKTGQVKVTDFGIARAITGNTIAYQQATTVLGSVHYFSPEQARGGATDVKSDIYSLGIVMYEMLTGELPFSGESPVSVALKHLQESFVEPRQRFPEIPQGLENIVLRCLVKSPEHRYPDMNAVRADLNQVLMNPDVPKFVAPLNDEIEEATIAVPALGGPKEPVVVEDELPAEVVAKPARRIGRVFAGIGISLCVLVVAAFSAYYIEFHWLVPSRTLTMPTVIGKSEPQAVQQLLKTQFLKQNIIIKRAYNSNYPIGEVYHQEPAAAQTVMQTRDIYLYVSKGPLQIQMPDLQSYPKDQAVQDLVNRGFSENNIKIEYTHSDNINKDLVVDTNPEAGSTVSIDQQVIVTVSEGPQTTVPMVIGLTLTEAKQLILDEGLQIGKVNFVAAPGAQDQTVVNTDPYSPMQPVAPNTVINLYVADNSGSQTTVPAPSQPGGNSTPATGGTQQGDTSGTSGAAGSSGQGSTTDSTAGNGSSGDGNSG